MRFAAKFLLGSFLVAVPGAAIALLVAQDAQQRPAGSSSEAGAAYDVPGEEVATHETGNHKAVRLRLEGQGRIFQSVHLLLIVDSGGKVISATPKEGPSEAYPRAIAEAMSWKYVPFEKDGAPTTAAIADDVRVLPPEELSKSHQDFPSTSNLAGLVMTLSRSGCYGTCASYNIEIHGDGTAVYKGEGFVVLTGEHRDHLSAEQVSEIVEAFRKADYFSLKDGYSYSVTDCPTYKTSFRIDQVEKSVTDYVGDEAGMPQSVSDLEETIDRVADTGKWIRGDAQTVSALKKEEWDFKSPEAAKVLARASEAGNSALVSDLLAEGVGLSGASETGNSALAAALAGDRTTVRMLIKAGAGKDDKQMKTEALAAAAEAGDLELVRLLLDYGADPKGQVRQEYRSNTVLMSAVGSGVPEIVETILAAHPDVNARDEKGHTALWYLFSEENPSMDEKRHADRARVVHLVAHAGADLNAQDNEGNAALHSAFDAEIAGALIQDGANVDIRNANGETPLMRNFSVDADKLLVAAGADIHARNREGKTAVDLAQEMEPGGERARFLASLSSAKTVQN